MARIINIALIALVVIGKWGGRFLASSEPARDGVMSFVSEIDAWLLRDAYSPTFIIVGLSGLLAIWVAMPIARFWREKLFGATRRKFFDEFRSIEQTISRRDFRWNLERAFRQHNPNAQSGELADMLRNLEWPEDFPPTDDKIAYAQIISWPDANGQSLWAFMDALFRDAFNTSKGSKYLSDTNYRDLLTGRLVAAKFWDDWAKQMIDGLLNPASVSGALASNKSDINALAMAKLALGKEVGWDLSQGTIALFRLALHNVEIAGGALFARARRIFAGSLEDLARKIRGNGNQ